jgi:class 3 adenylate cyclase
MSPRICTACETSLCNVKFGRQIVIDSTILFADIRGYTSLSDSLDSQYLLQILGQFYEHTSRAVWKSDGIVNKFTGDATLAIFNWPIRRQDHVMQAVLAGIALQEMFRTISTKIDELDATRVPA